MSDRRIAGRGAITTDQLLLRLFGRDFGTVMEDANRFQQPVPDFLGPLISDLRAGSAILTLDDPVNEEGIFDAYKHDVHFLQGRFDQLQGWVRSCIEASLKSSDNFDRDDRVKTGWKFVEQHIPPVAHAPLIDLPAERAALPADQLLVELKREVDIGIDSMMKQFCLWLDLLVSKEYVGIVHFTGPKVGHYYYFRPYTTERVEVTNHNETSVDLTVPFGQQTTYTTIEGRRYKITESVERHDHHIVRARIDTLGDYTGTIPDRIVRALNGAPDWLRPHLRVVSGDITKEVVRQRVVREHEEFHERVTSTYKGSPAITLGQHALMGWSDDDTKREGVSFFKGQKARGPAIRRVRLQISAYFIMAAVILAAFVGLLWYEVSEANRERAEAYQTYRNQHTTGRPITVLGKTTVTVRLDKGVSVEAGENTMIELEGGQPLYYLGASTGNVLDARNFYTLTSDPKESWRTWNRYMFPLPEEGPNSRYGSVDLGPDMGIPAMMHVLHADGKSIQFTIDYYTNTKN